MNHLHYIGEIRCEHTYSAPYRGLELIPTNETKALCIRENIWLNKTDHSVSIYSETFDENLVNESLMFWIQVTDVQFYNYTQLDKLLSNPHYLLFCSNQKEIECFDHENRTIKNVQRTTQMVVFDQEVEEEDTIKVFHSKGHLVYETNVYKGAKNSLIDLTYEDDGLYTWTFGGYSGNFFLTDKNLKNTLGVCMFNIKSEHEHHITIHFDAQKTYWEYLIIPKDQHARLAYEIIDQHDQYTFTCLGEVIIAEIQAISFISDQEIPYKAYPKTLFKLVPKAPDLHPYLSFEDRLLPNASPRNIQIHQTAEGTAFKTQTILYL